MSVIAADDGADRDDDDDDDARADGSSAGAVNAKSTLTREVWRL